MKHALPAVLIVLLTTALFWWLMPPVAEPVVARVAADNRTEAAEPAPAEGVTRDADDPNATPDETADSGPANAAARPARGPVPGQPRHVILPAVAYTPAGPELNPGLTPAVVLENMRGVFRQYSSRFGGNPVGTNPEITAALNGQNPRQAVLLSSEDGMRINERGELVDNWGTPYFFHQLSRTQMEIHSAGPDRRMWTPDDLVIK